jgi:glucosyl-3-phosphoglycerate synthase
MKAGHHFLDHPMEAPFIPSWNRVASAMPDIHQQVVRAVEKDMEVHGRPMKKATELAVA